MAFPFDQGASPPGFSLSGLQPNFHTVGVSTADRIAKISHSLRHLKNSADSNLYYEKDISFTFGFNILP
jgi:hypothetical protein